MRSLNPRSSVYSAIVALGGMCALSIAGCTPARNVALQENPSAEAQWQAAVDEVVFQWDRTVGAQAKCEVTRVRLERLLSTAPDGCAPGIFLFLARLNLGVGDTARALYYYELAYEADMSRVEAVYPLIRLKYDKKVLDSYRKELLEGLSESLVADLPGLQWPRRLRSKIHLYTKGQSKDPFELPERVSVDSKFWQREPVPDGTTTEEDAEAALAKGDYEQALRAAL